MEDISNYDIEEDLFIQILKTHFGEEFVLNPDNDKSFEPIIIVDKREKRSGIIDELELLGAQVIEETLDTGDYLISSSLAVERKRGDDFYSSLFSGSNKTNIFDELVRLTDSVETPVLILEDFKKMFKRGEEFISSLYGAIVSIATDLRLPIIPTRNISDTALVLYRMGKQQQIKTKRHSIARRVPRKMTLKARQMYFLEGFNNVGPTKSEKLIEVFDTPLNFITGLMNTDVLYTRTGNPKGINGPLSEVKGLGWKFVQANKKLLQQREDENQGEEK